MKIIYVVVVRGRKYMATYPLAVCIVVWVYHQPLLYDSAPFSPFFRDFVGPPDVQNSPRQIDEIRLFVRCWHAPF